MIDFNSHLGTCHSMKNENNILMRIIFHSLIVCDSLTTCDNIRPDFRNKTMSVENLTMKIS